MEKILSQQSPARRDGCFLNAETCSETGSSWERMEHIKHVNRWQSSRGRVPRSIATNPWNSRIRRQGEMCSQLLEKHLKSSAGKKPLDLCFQSRLHFSSPTGNKANVHKRSFTSVAFLKVCKSKKWLKPKLWWAGDIHTNIKLNSVHVFTSQPNCTRPKSPILI